MSDGSPIQSMSPHSTAMDILQDQYKADHPYKSLFTSLTYDDVKEDPELAAQYAQIVDQMNKAQNTGNVDMTVAPCPYENQVIKPSNPDCNASSLKVTKAGRKFDLIVNVPNADRKPTTQESILEVVGGTRLNPAKISGEISGLVNNCSSHKDKKPWNLPFGKVKNMTPNFVEIDLPSSDKLHLFPWNASSKDYSFNANTCSKSYSATVKVYPDIEVDCSVSIDLAGESTEVQEDSSSVVYDDAKKSKKGQTLTGEKRQSTTTYEVFSLTQGISFSANYKKDGVQISFKKSFAQIVESINRIGTVVNGIQEFVEKVTGESKSAIKRRKEKVNESVSEESRKRSEAIQKGAPKDSISITYPNLTLAFAGKWEEMEGDYRVDCAGTVELACNPLIKLGIKKDVSQYILNTTPAGAALSKVKEFLKELEIETMVLFVELSGELSGKVKHYAYVIQDSKTEGELTLKIPLTVTAILLKKSFSLDSIYVKSYVLKTDVDVSAKGETGVQFDAKLRENTKSKSLELDLSGQFLGIEVSITAIITVSIEDKQKAPAGYVPVDEKHNQPDYTKTEPGSATKDADSNSGGINYKQVLYKMEPIDLFKKTINF